MKFRVGLGQDSHPFEKGGQKPLVLGGVRIAEKGGLQGNSDADVILHALFNALSSAVGQDSIGVYADKMCLEDGISDSREYLKVALEMVNKAGFKVNNISVAVEAKRPRLSLESIQQIKVSLAQLSRIKREQVGVTFTSGEGLTAFGRGEAISAFVVASLTEK